MSLIRKPSQLEVTPTLTAMIYGQPGLGKTTLACSAPNPILFDFDGGVSRIHGAHQPMGTLQVKSWEEVLQAIEEIKTDPELKEVQSIIIDTAGKMLMYMEDYIKRTQPKMKQLDGSLSLKGYGVRKQMFIQFNKDLRMMGKHVIYVAHEIEQKRGDETVIRPEIGGSSSNDLIKELDLVGYMEAYGTQRTINFDPCEKFYAKNTCNMAGKQDLPVLVDANNNAVGKNDFMQKVINGYHNRLATNKELTAKFEDVCELIHNNSEEITNLEDLENFIKWVDTIEHVFNSKAVAQQDADAKLASFATSISNAEEANSFISVLIEMENYFNIGKSSSARMPLMQKVNELGLKFNKATKMYTDGEAA